MGGQPALFYATRHETTLSIAAYEGLWGKILQIGYNLENFAGLENAFF
jgi:hypothetical protein